MKVALVHDYLREYGGAERVLETLHEMYPKAPVYVAFADPVALGLHWQRFADWEIRESVAGKFPGTKKIYSPLRVLAAWFFEQFDLSGYDLVISSTNVYMAKAVITRGKTKHLCYCHTPPRSLYGYTTMTDWKKNPLIRIGGELINLWMRRVDFMTAQRPDLMVANSEETRGRIRRFYHRDAVVVYPPVSLAEADHQSKTKDYFLYVGRLAQSKHADLAVAACATLGLPLKVVGKGGGEAYLRSLAGDHVEFLGGVDDISLAHLYQDARAVIFPAEDEDFGIVPVEAMCAGTPVIAHRSGGPKETVIDGKTGVFFDDLTLDSLMVALRQFESLKFDSRVIKQHAKKFSKEVFKKKITSLALELVQTHKDR